MKTISSMIRKIALLTTATIAVGSVPAQDAAVDLNEYYRFPASIGLLYQPLSAVGSRALGDFGINELSGEVRVPIGPVPVLQPFVRGGVVDLVFLGELGDVQQDWSHRHFFGGLGLGASGRISKEFELGLDLGASYSQTIFDSLVYAGEAVSRAQGAVIGAVDLRIALNPSYNLSISIRPSARYVYSLGMVHDFDGLTFGIGVGASYRFGPDPDAPTADIRAIHIADTSLPGVFAAMQSYYASNPLGSVSLTNSESFDVSNVSVSFFQAGFMDSPTPVAQFDQIEPGETVNVPVKATFNDQVFTTQGITPLTGEIIVEYVARNRPIEQRQPVTYELHDRNSVTWSDDRKAGAFITPADSAVRNYSSFIRQANREATNDFLSANLQFAMQAYEALTELGILYQIDPTSPFTQVQENTVAVDSISFPRETLTRLTGDCDDLTVLFNTMLETVGIPSGFVTTPGHIYSAFDTGIAPADHELVHPDRNMLLELDGSLWVLVEITLLGRAGFLEAWNTGIREYQRYDTNPAARGFYRTADAQGVFRPVSLRETDLGLQYGDPDAISERFAARLESLTDLILEPYFQTAQQNPTERSWNAYGVAAARTGAYSAARGAFQEALALNPESVNAQLNLGSLHFLDTNYEAALDVFRSAEDSLESGIETRRRSKLNVYLNLSKTLFALEDYEEASAYHSRAQEVDPDVAAQFAYLGSGDTGRASDAAGEDPIFFFEDE